MENKGKMKYSCKTKELVITPKQCLNTILFIQNNIIIFSLFPVCIYGVEYVELLFEKIGIPDK
jgi:hypothetical protein